MLDLLVVPLVAGLVILSIHAYLGLHVIRRGVIFVDLAFAQIAALGTTVAMLFGVGDGTVLYYLFAFGFTMLGALIFSFTRLEDSIVPQEAIIGIAYVVASAAVILLAGLTAEGAEHIKETLTGTLIWADWPAVYKMAIPYALIGAFYWFARRPLLAVTVDPSRVSRPRLWDFVFYATFGVVISFSVDIAGVLMVFSALVIPAVIAFLYTPRFARALVVAWVTGALALVAGLALSFGLDLATGPSLVCVFGLALVVAGGLRPLVGSGRPPARLSEPERGAGGTLAPAGGAGGPAGSAGATP